MRESLEKEMELFFEQLSKSPMYKRHCETFKDGGVDNILFEKTGEHIQKRIHSFAYNMLGELEKFPRLNKPSCKLTEDLISVFLSSSKTAKINSSKLYDLVYTYSKKFIPVFLNNWIRED